MRIRMCIGTTLLALLAAAPAYGQRAANVVEGVLHLTTEEAWITTGAARVRLIQVPRQTAVDMEPLLSQTAGMLVDLAGQQVRASGDLDGGILWSAVVEEVEEEEKAQVVQVVEVNDEKKAGDCPPAETAEEEAEKPGKEEPYQP